MMEIFYNNTNMNNNILGKHIQKCTVLHFYCTSNRIQNDIDRLTDIVIEQIIKNNEFLIVGNDVCVPNSLAEFENYAYEKYIGKKIVLLYGNCHTGIVKEYLKTSEEFKKKYEIYPIKEIQEVSDPSYFDLSVFQVCDVFIHQSIWKKNRYGEKYASDYVISKLDSRCLIISIPNLYHLPKCLFPQYYEAQELRYRGQTYFFRDRIIDEGLMQGMSIKQIIDGYYEYPFDKEKIKNEYYNFLDIVKRREIEWDIKVSDFIISTIQKYSLFFEMNHPTNVLIKYYAIEILKILFKNDYKIGELNNIQLDSYQMPLLTSVQNALELDYSSQYHELRITGVKIKRKTMDLQEYVKEYFASIWMCGEFSRKLNLQSKIMFYIYKIQGIYMKVFNKLVEIVNKLKENN